MAEQDDPDKGHGDGDRDEDRDIHDVTVAQSVEAVRS